MSTPFIFLPVRAWNICHTWSILTRVDSATLADITRHAWSILSHRYYSVTT